MTLDPCKFCGSEKVEPRVSDPELMLYCVNCLSCGAQGPFVGCDSPEDARDAWNRTPEEWERKQAGSCDG